MPVNRPDRAAETCHRNKNRRQHERDSDERAGDLLHRLARRFERRKTFLGHDAFHVFHDDDGVIDENADRQHHAEHRQHVDGKSEREHGYEGAEQRDRNHNRRDERCANILEKNIHHEKNQRDGFNQRFENFLDGNPHEG